MAKLKSGVYPGGHAFWSTYVSEDNRFVIAGSDRNGYLIDRHTGTTWQWQPKHIRPLLADAMSLQPRLLALGTTPCFQVGGSSGTRWLADSSGLVVDTAGGYRLLTLGGELYNHPAFAGLIWKEEPQPAPDHPTALRSAASPSCPAQVPDGSASHFRITSPPPGSGLGVARALTCASPCPRPARAARAASGRHCPPGCCSPGNGCRSARWRCVTREAA